MQKVIIIEKLICCFSNAEAPILIIFHPVSKTLSLTNHGPGGSLDVCVTLDVSLLLLTQLEPLRCACVRVFGVLYEYKQLHHI